MIFVFIDFFAPLSHLPQIFPAFERLSPLSVEDCGMVTRSKQKNIGEEKKSNSLIIPFRVNLHVFCNRTAFFDTRKRKAGVSSVENRKI